MTTHKTKPATISAFRLGSGAIPKWFREMVDSEIAFVYITQGGVAKYASVIGDKYKIVANEGDHLVQDSEGHVYAVDHEVFETLFERIK